MSSAFFAPSVLKHASLSHDKGKMPCALLKVLYVGLQFQRHNCAGDASEQHQVCSYSSLEATGSLQLGALWLCRGAGGWSGSSPDWLSKRSYGRAATSYLARGSCATRAV